MRTATIIRATETEIRVGQLLGGGYAYRIGAYLSLSEHVYFNAASARWEACRPQVILPDGRLEPVPA